MEEDFALISQDAAGRTQKAFDKMASTVGFKVTKLKEQVKATGRALGVSLLGDFALAVQDVTLLFLFLEDMFLANKDAITDLARSFSDQVLKMTTSIKDFILGIESEGFETKLKELGERIGGLIGEGLLSALKKIFTFKNIGAFLETAIANNALAIANRVDRGLPAIATPFNREERRAGGRAVIFNRPQRVGGL